MDITVYIQYKYMWLYFPKTCTYGRLLLTIRNWVPTICYPKDFTAFHSEKVRSYTSSWGSLRTAFHLRRLKKKGFEQTNSIHSDLEKCWSINKNFSEKSNSTHFVGSTTLFPAKGMSTIDPSTYSFLSLEIQTWKYLSDCSLEEPFSLRWAVPV